MQTIALVIHVFLAIGVIGLVLIQHGKGAEAGAAFGSGASSTVFGSKGSGSFLTRATTLFALAFFCTSMLLFFMAAQRSGSSGIGSVVDGIEAPAAVQELDVPAMDNTIAPNSASDVPATPGAADSSSSSESDVPAAPTAAPDLTPKSE